MKERLLILLLILFFSFSYSQIQQWSKVISYPTSGYFGGIGCDTLNNVYVMGQFEPGIHYSPLNKNGFFRSRYEAVFRKEFILLS
jgi:hypothetical protein